MTKSVAYGLRLAILYTLIWFVDLLDLSILNVALPSIAHIFHVDPTDAEWTIIGFTLAMTVSMAASGALGDRFGVKRLFLLSQALYIISSVACGAAQSLEQLIVFRILQGAAGGLIIPLGMATLLRVMPQKNWAKTSAYMNMVTLVAPAAGMLLAGYVTAYLGWRWLFFVKIPLSVFCFILSLFWVKESAREDLKTFDYQGFILSSISLTFLLLALSFVGKTAFSFSTLLLFFIVSLVTLFLFVWRQLKAKHPLIVPSIFKSPFFTFGNAIQIAANLVFLGGTFIIAVFLQEGLHISLTATSWIMAMITPGMLLVMPFVAKLYNKKGPLPFMVPGLVLMSGAMLAFLFVDANTSYLWLAFLIFCEGIGSALTQTANVMAIFSEIKDSQKGGASSAYSLFKQIAASVGVAITTMIVSVALTQAGLVSLADATTWQVTSLFKPVFLFLGVVPLLALGLCLFIDNKKALKKVDHFETETEIGLE